MLRFLLKKSFFDIWDNFIPLFISNIATAAVILGLYILLQVTGEVSIGVLAVILAIFLAILTVMLFALNGMAHQWSDWKSDCMHGLCLSIKNNPGHMLFFYVITCTIGFCVLFMFPFYMQSNSYMGILMAVVLFWIFLVVVPAMIYYIPLALYMPDDGAFLTFKKCLALVLNNKAVTLFVFLRTVLDVIITLGTCLLVPGITGICVIHQDTVRLLLMKHDYMRKHLCKGEDVDWRAVLEKEEATLGPRSIRTIIFPWKD